MKRVISISLGTSKRDKASKINLLGQNFEISRVGTDGDQQKFAGLFSELDGKVDAFGVGGADIYVVAKQKKYSFKQIEQLIQGAKKTPVVDGSGLKHTLEREAIRVLQEKKVLDFSKEKVLLVSAVDRYGMAEALAKYCPNVLFGDLLFGLGLPIAIRKYHTVESLGSLLLPIVTKLPFQWFYPTGEKQEKSTPKFKWAFDEATVIAGDWHYIRRYAPNRLDGKTIITQSLRKQDIEWLGEAGALMAITTTPVIEGETFATNVMEAVLVTLLAKNPLDIQVSEYLEVLKKLEWQPNLIDFSETRKKRS